MTHRHIVAAQPANIVSLDRKSTRLNSSHVAISYAVFCLKKKRHKAISLNRFDVGALCIVVAAVSRRLGASPVSSRGGCACAGVAGICLCFFFFFLMNGRPPRSTLFPNTTLCR